MSVALNINGTDYLYPVTGDVDWGPEATDWAVAVTNGMLQKAGGLFQLLGEVDFGSAYGIKSKYYSSRATIAAAAGAVRLGNTETLSWRDFGDSADLALGVNASNQLTFVGTPIQPEVITVSDTSTIDMTYLAGNISAAIITGSIGNSLIATAAAIALTKLAPTIFSRALVSDGSGLIVPATTTATEIGYVNGVTSAIQTQLNAKQATGNYITALTGDVTASGPGSSVATLATVTIGKGGTGQTTKAAGFDALSPMSASGDIIIGGTSGTGTRLPKGIDGQGLVLVSGVPAWASAASPVYTSPTVKIFNQILYYTFTVTAANATIGATYTNNGQTFTVVYTIASGTTLVCSATGAPTSSGTLTKSGGTGDSTIAFSANVANGTYVKPASVLYIKVTMVGGGGGASGMSNANVGTDGGSGGTTTFGTSLLTCFGGTGASQTNGGGTGSTPTVQSPAIATMISTGTGGGSGFNVGTGGGYGSGGLGGSSPFGGVGRATDRAISPVDSIAGSGSGGTGPGNNAFSSTKSGSGGASGGYLQAIIPSPSSTYAFAIGAAGTAGTGASNGGAGGSGQIIVEEFYQ